MYQIVTDGAWDMDSERARALDVAVVPFYVATDGETYLKEIEERSVRDVYEFMVAHPNEYPKTAQPSVENIHFSYCLSSVSACLQNSPAR